MSVGLLVVRLLYCFYVFGHLLKWFTFSVLLSVIFCRVVVFYACTQLVYRYDKIIQYLLNWVDMYDYNHTKVKHKKFLQIIKAVFNFLPSIFANM